MGIGRRSFLKAGALASGGLFLGSWLSEAKSFGSSFLKKQASPAILGGAKAHPGTWPKWPLWKDESWDKRVVSVLRSGIWSRADITSSF